MRIWLDADATPRDVKDIVFRAAHRLAIETVVVANQRVPIPLGAPTISAVRVEGGPDVADRYNRCECVTWRWSRSPRTSRWRRFSSRLASWSSSAWVRAHDRDCW
jgi:hypothetical protein